MANKHLAKAFICLWMALLVGLGVYYVAFAPRDGAYSHQENRTLTAFPTASADKILSGSFGQSFEDYLLDHFPGRNQVIHAANRLYSTLSFASHNEYLLVAEDSVDLLDNSDYEASVDELLQDFTAPTQPEQTEPAETAPGVTVPLEDPPIEEKPAASLQDFPAAVGCYMDTGKGPRPMDIYSRNNVAAVTAMLNKCARVLPANGKLMFTVAPRSIYGNQFVNAKTKVSYYADWDDVINGLGDDNVYAFDTAEILSEAIIRDEYVYFRTDMHWTPYGSYLVYRQMAQRAGKSPCSYEEDFTVTVEEPFRGTYYRDEPAAYAYVKPDRLELLTPKWDLELRRITGPDQYKLIDFLNFNASPSDRYTVYLGGPGGPWTYAQCDNGQEENCLLIADSFGLSFLPFLTANYGQVHYHDARFFDQALAGGSISELMEKYNIQDVYVVVCDLHSFASGFLLTDVNNQLGQ